MKHGKIVIAGTIAATLVLSAGGWFQGVQPFLAAAAASESELAGVQQLNDLQATRLAQLQAEGERVDSLRSELAELQVEIPTDPAMAELLGELAVLETRTGARVAGVTSGSATLIGSPVSQASGDDGAAASDSAASVEPLVQIPGLQAMPVTLSASGSASAVRAFLAGLQSDGRLVAMSAVTFGTDPADQTSRVDISGSVYILPSV